jgi:hypothetical protein
VSQVFNSIVFSRISMIRLSVHDGRYSLVTVLG